MTTVQVEQLTFTFMSSVDPFQYEQGGRLVDGWPAGAKVVDIVANAVPDIRHAIHSRR